MQFDLVGISSVRNKYDFMWNAKDEDITYPSLVIDDFLYLGEEESALEKVTIFLILSPFLPLLFPSIC